MLENAVFLQIPQFPLKNPVELIIQWTCTFISFLDALEFIWSCVTQLASHFLVIFNQFSISINTPITNGRSHNLRIIKNIRSDSGNGLPFTNAPPSWLTPECPKSGWKWSSENSKRKKIPNWSVCWCGIYLYFGWVDLQVDVPFLFRFSALVIVRDRSKWWCGIGYIMNHLSVYVCNGFFICSFGRKIMWKYFLSFS